MAPGRKRASFRHRSQSDNGVIIELTPLSLRGCISLRLLPCLGAAQRRPSWLQRQLGLEGGALLCAWRGVDSGAQMLLCTQFLVSGPACTRSVVTSSIGKQAGLSNPVAWVVLEAGVSGRKRLCRSRVCFLLLLVDWEGGLGKFLFSFQESVETLKDTRSCVACLRS